MRFGLFLPQGWRLDLVDVPPARHWPVITDLASRADAGPWESVWVYDHMHTAPLTTGEATHEAWTLMSALGAATTRVRLGQMCTCLGYRNPALLAKMASTVDHISGGRVEMGIGAGWYEHEWRAYGYGFPSAGERIAMLDEGVRIMRDAWADGIVSLEGDHFRIDGAIVQPRPLQEGGIPTWIAGGGERKTLRIAARHADYTNFDGSPEGFAHKSQVLARHCADLGRDPSEITRTANYNVAVGETERDVADRLAFLRDRMARHVGQDEAERQLGAYRGLPAVGTPEQIVDKLRGLESLGMTYGVFYFPEIATDTSGLALFEREVIPALA
ncbi:MULTISPECIES: LLM class F420-dependent oxidoreductase [unclassified Dietzia]|uniref:LLM class F420-dependent oxidoreductase n=1 Tax=unclassified Dietzia TaxID=2617939 RepID=UPI0015FE0DE9|nr:MULTISPECIES: LLM class F420-dependent oxidoreductase [unclassified Dietzia]MBB1024923.1 LLM class F420-dependent oxidoreductase [Dietzia sp. DQ12-76]MBB1029186.1 LLM class F420-dependent oxidoreductase [Dietzia sp. DQ11-38-2]